MYATTPKTTSSGYLLPGMTGTSGVKSGYPSTVTPSLVQSWYGGTPTKEPTATQPTGKTAAELAAEALAAYMASLNQTSSEGGGGGSYSASMPSYSPQAYQVNLPTIDWNFNPTEQQRAGWNTQATATAAQEIDPQLQAIQAALQQYLTQGQNTRNELNPRYTNQSLGIANIIKNSVKQDAIDNAIRRGAEQSGWLPQALMEAGKLETQERSNIESQRNQDLAALAALEAQQTQAAGEQGTMLEGLRGKRITTALADLENQAWAREQQEKESTWNSALGGETLRASAYGDNASNQLAAYQAQVAASQSEADRALQAAIAANEQRNTEWNQQYQTSTDAYNRILATTQNKVVAKDPNANKVPVSINGVTVYVSPELAYQIQQDKAIASLLSGGNTTNNPYGSYQGGWGGIRTK